MSEIEVERTIPAGDAFDALDSQLRAQYPVYTGAVSGRGLFRAQVTDKVTEADAAGIRELILTFDIRTRSAEQQAKATSLAAIKAAANSAADVALTDLTAGQVKALMAVLLWRAGGVTPDGKVRPLSEWVK